MCDLTMIMYSSIAAVSTFGSCLFVGWFIRSGFRATSVYMYVTLLLVGETIRSWTNVYARKLSLLNDGSFYEFSLTWVWESRSILTLLALTAIVLHMSYRILTGKNPEVPEEWSKKIRKLVCGTRKCE